MHQAFVDAQKKDRGVDPATLAWLLSELSIGPEARLPGGVNPTDLLAFRDELVLRLRAMALDRARAAQAANDKVE